MEGFWVSFFVGEFEGVDINGDINENFLRFIVLLFSLLSEEIQFSSAVRSLACERFLRMDYVVV